MKPIKKVGKSFLSILLERQVQNLRKMHPVTVVAVAGSVGKTSTKMAIAAVLGTKKRVQFQAGNYNDRVTVPLIFFGQQEPGIFDVFAWLKLLRQNTKQINAEYPYDIVVVELGTDGPGQMARFAYLQPDIVVLTAIADEHMEQFKTLDAVAQEELTVKNYAKTLLINMDDTPERYLRDAHFKGYAAHARADYLIGGLQVLKFGETEATVQLPANSPLFVKLHLLGKQGAKIALAAAAVAHMLGYDTASIREGLSTLKPPAGRLRTLAGKNDSTLIDDTYNASPVAVRAALDVLCAAQAPQRIAILGSMNELGADSAANHQAIGDYCDPKQLDLVITVGEQANSHLAPAAIKQGCTVKSFVSPTEAGDYALANMEKGAFILAKGSQNGVFAEEALKPLLKDPVDAAKLVRQSPYWMAQKRAQFDVVPASERA